MPVGAGKARHERLVREAIDTQDIDELFELLETEPDTSNILRVIQELVIAKARDIVVQGAEVASYWPQTYYGKSYREHQRSKPYNWVLRRTDPVKEPDTIGAALVLTDGHPAHPDRPEFRLVTLRYVTYYEGIYWEMKTTLLRPTQISLLNLNNPEHLRLIWDVIGNP